MKWTLDFFENIISCVGQEIYCYAKEEEEITGMSRNAFKIVGS